MQPSTFNDKRALFSCIICLLTFSHGPCAQAAAGGEFFEVFQRQTGSSCLPASSIATATSGTFRASSTVECAQNCAKDGSCLAHVYSALPGTCSLLSDVTALTGSCSVSESTGLMTWVRASKVPSTTTSAEPQCQNGGQKKVGGGCKCFHGYVGSYCERLMEDCMEAKDSGHYDLGWRGAMLTANPSLSPHNMTVLCRGNGQTVILRQIEAHKGGLNFTWREFLDGFTLPDASGAHWMGLRNLYYISNSKSYRLALYIRLHDSTLIRLRYNSFKVQDDVNFTVQLGSYATSAKPELDLMGDLNGKPFSSYDHYHGDDSFANCVQKQGGGWWFGASCATWNYTLVGKMSTGVNGTDASGYVFYGSYLGSAMRLFTFSLE